MNTRGATITALALYGLLLAARPSPAGDAEDAGPVAPGTRVRVTLDHDNSKRLTGEVLESSPTSILLRTDTNASAKPRRLDLKAVSKLEISDGMHRRVLSGAIDGALLFGLVTAVVIGPFGPICYDGPCKRDGLEGRNIRDAAIIGAALGAAIGTGNRGERWKKVAGPRPHAALGLVPERKGFRAGATVSFP